MALINCPECGKEISDKAGACPSCGCPIGESGSKKHKKIDSKKVKLLVIVLCAVFILITALVILYVCIIKPTNIYNKAVKEYENGNIESAIELLEKLPDNNDAQLLINDILYNEAVAEYEKGNTQEAINLLEKIPNDEKGQSLTDKIIYNEALDAFQNGKIEEAKDKLKAIPEYSETPLLLAEIEKEETYKNALNLLEQGKYEETAALFQEIMDYKNTSELFEQMKYESYAYSCVKSFKKMLKNPDSFIPYEIEFYASSDKKDLYPVCIIYYGAQNGFGGNTTGYVLCSKENDATDYEVEGYCDSLDENSYGSDLDDLLEKIICLRINTIKKFDRMGDIDMSRFKSVLKNEAYIAIKIIE